MTDTQLRMTYLGDGISTDEDFEEEGEEGIPYVAPAPSEDEMAEGEDAPENPDEV